MLNMRFSVFFAVLTFVLYVNASLLIKRDISTAVQKCVSDVSVAYSYILDLNSYVQVYQPSQGYAGALTLQAKEAAFEARLATAGTDCCSFGGATSDEESLALLDAFETLTIYLEDMANQVIIQKPKFDSVALVTPLIKNDIISLYSKVKTVYTCFVASVGSAYTSEAQGYFDRVKAAFQAAGSAYGTGVLTR